MDATVASNKTRERDRDIMTISPFAVEKLAPIAAEMRRISADPGFVDAVLKDGGERASFLAEKTMRNVRDIVGFLQN